MRELSDPPDALESYERALAAGDTAAAKDLVLGLLDDGADPVTVLTDVVAAAQRSVGERWQRGEWTVAEEHAATAIALTATKAVARVVRKRPVTRGRVLVACAEKEWHALPAMIIDCALRANGWDSVLLGAATSPLRLNQYLQDHGPEATAVSCSVLGSLPTTRRFIEASTAAGVPVVVGGPAFGYDDVRARALGATAWAASAHGAVSAMEDLPPVVPPVPPLPPAEAAELAALELDHGRLVDELRSGWSLSAGAATPTAFDRADVGSVAGDVLHQVLHAIAAALLTGDARPLPETAYWISDLLRTRGGDGGAVRELRDVLVATLADYPLARRLVEQHFLQHLG
jgi:MerR family transcriptional regulator, light-induced transcriptional regulator